MGFVVVDQRPPRTFGLSIAIIASVVLFTVIPLLQVGMVLRTQQFFTERDYELPASDESAIVPIAVGGDYIGVSTAAIVVQAGLAVTFLVIAILAWRGKPRRIGFIMILAVIGLTILSSSQSIAAVFAQQDIVNGFDSGSGISRSLACINLLFQIGVPLYVVWYLSRAPARAFYRGYY